MQDIWYGDDRDLVKWAALVHLAARQDLAAIVQVAMFRPGARFTLRTKSGRVDLPESVWTHFRELAKIRTLGKRSGIKIHLIKETFDSSDRRRYFARVASILRRVKHPKAVLLDPDTGLEPRKANAKHVTRDEVHDVWDMLAKGDWLLLYQHRWFDPSWRKIARSKFKSACGVSGVEILRASKRPSDVILLAACKA
jgi:hypothetical protein